LFKQGGFLESAKRASAPPGKPSSSQFVRAAAIQATRWQINSAGVHAHLRGESLTGLSPIGSDIPVAPPFKKTCPFDPAQGVCPKGNTQTRPCVLPGLCERWVVVKKGSAGFLVGDWNTRRLGN
jgi:hypothetical protein